MRIAFFSDFSFTQYNEIRIFVEVRKNMSSSLFFACMFLIFMYKTDRSRRWDVLSVMFASCSVEYLEKSKSGRMVSSQSPRPRTFMGISPKLQNVEERRH